MAPPLLTLTGTGLRFGAKPLFEGLDLVIQPRDRLCLIGRNGMGKSSLMKIIAGLIEPDQGARFQKPGVYSRYLDQAPDLSAHASVAEALETASRGEPIEPIAAELNIRLDADPKTLSGGELRRVALAQVFLGDPDLLLLDEPTNHLDLLAIDWLESRLRNYRGAFVLISHDRRLLERVTGGCLWLDQGVLRRHEKGFADYDNWVEQVAAEEENARQRETAHLKQELHWLARGVTARRKRNQGRLRKLNDLREARRNRAGPVGSAALKLENTGPSGKLVIEAEHISKSYGGRAIITDFSTRILRGDRIGLIGPNGAGKTTLLNMLTGRLTPDSGALRIGQTVEMLFIDQKRSDLNDADTLRDVLSHGGDYVDVRGAKQHVAGYLKDFLFDPAQAQSPVGSLSGGEKNRLLLARAFAQPANLVVLDEPTNDLDMDTLDLLEEVLADFDGTVLLVSHDRDFLDRLVTSTIVMNGDGKAEEFVGGFSDWERATGGLKARQTRNDGGKKSAAAPKPQAARKEKLSYKDSRALELLPKEMAQAEAEIKKLEALLADPHLYSQNPDAFARATKALEDAQATLAAKEETWLELEMKREALEG